MRAREPRLRLDTRFTHWVASDGSFVLVGDEDSALVEGEGVADLLPLLDGSRTALQVASVLADRYPREVTHFVLLRLLASGLIRELAAESVVEPEGANLSQPEAVELRRIWESRETSVVCADFRRSSRVVLAEDYLCPELPLVVEADSGSRSLLLVRVGARDLWLGPRVRHADGACVSCLQERLRVNLSARAFMRRVEAPRDVRIQALPATAEPIAFEMLLEWLDGNMEGATSGPSMLWVLPLDGGVGRAHRVDRLPHCPACGDPGIVSPGADLRIASGLDAKACGGGYRTCSAEETWARFSTLISSLTGVVRRLERVEYPEEELVHVYTASHAGSYGASSVKAVKDEARDISGGKGVTDLDARVSALCESLERFSAVHRGTEPTRLARRSGLGDRAIHPNDVMGFSPSQFAERTQWNSRLAGSFQWVPDPYEDQEIEWSAVRSLVTGDVSWVPSALVFLSFRGSGTSFCKGDSNGLAGGNCLEEAVLQGLLELVERDAIALWWYNRSRVPAVDLETSTDDYVVRLTDYYRRISRPLWALDLTTDLGIPCFAVISAAVGQPRDEIIFGFGCHLDAGIALRRAMTEANQLLPTVGQSLAKRRVQLMPDFRDAIEWWEAARLDDHLYLKPDPAAPRRELHGATSVKAPSLTSAIERCLTALATAGVDVLVYDHTRPDVGLAVAKVMAPGLRHLWRRLAPGRLYDVPPMLGWVESARTEEQMNRVSMFV